MSSEHDGQAVDPLGRAAVVTVAAARIGIGAAALADTRRALELLGFERPGGATVTLARMVGGRDVALGLHALAGASDPVELRRAALIGGLVDGVDTLAFAGALVGRKGIDRTAIANAPLGAAAAVASIWALRRLRRAGR
jgi:hypothetical protein